MGAHLVSSVHYGVKAANLACGQSPPKELLLGLNVEANNSDGIWWVAHSMDEFSDDAYTVDDSVCLATTGGHVQNTAAAVAEGKLL